VCRAFVGSFWVAQVRIGCVDEVVLSSEGAVLRSPGDEKLGVVKRFKGGVGRRGGEVERECARQ
jgi:hypothetical protein